MFGTLYLGVSLLAASLSEVAGDTEEGEEADGEGGLPHLHLAGADKPQDHKQPHKGHHGEKDRDEEDRIFFNPPCLARRNDTDTDGRDHEDVESSRPDDQV